MSKHNKLDLRERQQLYVWNRKGWEKRAIARGLKRHPSTILRELERNRHASPRIWREMSSYEQAKYAHDRAVKRRRESRRRERLKTHELRSHVMQMLIDEQWSPEQIAETLGEHIPGVSISTKSIYNFTRYERRELRKYLRRRGKAYRQRVANRRSRFREAAPEKKRLNERSKEANERLEFGHWEIDTIHSIKKSSRAILTLRERKTRQRFFFIIPNLKAESVVAVLRPFFKDLPQHMRKTLTSDNGSEFNVGDLSELEQIIAGFKIFYCNPYCAWQRGSVEHANGEFRWYFPKGTDFKNVSLQEIKEVQHKLNNRPMKLHGFKSSNAVYQEAVKTKKAA
jgi:IS30 family transposase